jgi:hypothetical protein
VLRRIYAPLASIRSPAVRPGQRERMPTRAWVKARPDDGFVAYWDPRYIGWGGGFGDRGRLVAVNG